VRRRPREELERFAGSVGATSRAASINIGVAAGGRPRRT
jgi:hypothetical protein